MLVKALALFYRYDIISIYTNSEFSAMTNQANLKSTKRVYDRIRALLAMGGDKSSLREAEIALRRARVLMDEHQITLSDVQCMSENGLGVSKYNLGSTQQKTWISTLALNVAKLNDCVVGYDRPTTSTEFITYEFKGFQEDVELCEFMIVYLVDTCNRMYERDRERLGLSGLLDKEDYLLGMSDKINGRIKEIIKARADQKVSLTDGRSLVLVKSAIVERAHGEQKKENTPLTRKANYKAYRGGRAASNDIHLGRFVSSKHEAAQALPK